MQIISGIGVTVDCISANSTVSGSNDDDTTIISCDSSNDGTLGYVTLTGCGFSTLDADNVGHDGSWGDDTSCTATTGATGNGVYAWARCCNFTEYTNDMSCMQKRSARSSHCDDCITSTECTGSYPFLTGCSYSSINIHLDGSFPGTTKPGMSLKATPLGPYSICTAQDGSNDFGFGFGIYAEAICCSTDLNLTCYTFISNPSDTGSATYSCPTNYFMSSCTGFSYFNLVNAAYVDSNGDCYVRGDSTDLRNIFAIAICCQVEIETTNPTQDPTSVPTNPPTTKAPTTQTPTTSNPTSLPTSVPTTKTPTTSDPTTEIPTLLRTTLAPTSSPTPQISTFYPSISPTTAWPTTQMTTLYPFLSTIATITNEENNLNDNLYIIIGAIIGFMVLMVIIFAIIYILLVIKKSKQKNKTNLNQRNMVKFVTDSKDNINKSLNNNINMVIMDTSNGLNDDVYGVDNMNMNKNDDDVVNLVNNYHVTSEYNEHNQQNQNNKALINNDTKTLGNINQDEFIIQDNTIGECY